MHELFGLNSRTPYAAIAGLCAFSASLFGKLTGSNEHIIHVCEGILSIWKSTCGYYIQTRTTCKGDIEILLIRVLFVICMVLCNAGVWTLYVKALQASKSSLPATLISNSTNFVLSALFGALIFEEATSLLWWSGTGLVIIGLLLVSGKDEKKYLAKKEE